MLFSVNMLCEGGQRKLGVVCGTLDGLCESRLLDSFALTHAEMTKSGSGGLEILLAEMVLEAAIAWLGVLITFQG